MPVPQPHGARDKLWYFRAAPVFAGAGEALLARLAAASTMRRDNLIEGGAGRLRLKTLTGLGERAAQ